jgi:Universal stress protein family
MTQLVRAEGGLGDALEMLSNQILARARERAQRAGLAKVTTRVAWGDAAESIIEAATREQADAVVVADAAAGDSPACSSAAYRRRSQVSRPVSSSSFRSPVSPSQLRLTRIKSGRGAPAKFRTPDIADFRDWNHWPFCAPGCEPIRVRFF